MLAPSLPPERIVTSLVLGLLLASMSPSASDADTLPFVRGDANADGNVDIADPILGLNYSFLGGPAPTCLRAADSNGDGDAAGISDAVFTLTFSFLGGPPPPAPFPECGTAADDGPSCDAFLPCDEPGDAECEWSIVSANPNDLATGVEPTVVVEIVFDAELDPEVLQSGTPESDSVQLLRLSDGEGVSGTAHIAGSSLLFVPDAPLARDAVYAFFVGAEILSTCDDQGNAAVATVFTTTDGTSEVAGVRHRYPGHTSRDYVNVGWDIDWMENIDLEWLRSSVEDAEALAIAQNIDLADVEFPSTITNDSAGYRRYTPFHFWPNIIDLSEVFQRDVELYRRMMNDLLVSDPEKVSLTADLRAELVRGDRIFLARDFVDVVQHEFRTYFEVHYALLINLDAKTTREPLVHRFADSGLPALHDAHVDALVAAFESTDGAPAGEVWDLCLRANFRRHLNTVNVDHLGVASELQFFIRRVDLSCDPGLPPPPPDDGDDEEPPPRRPPPGGGGGDEGGGRPPRAPLPEPPVPEEEGNEAGGPGGPCPHADEEDGLRRHQQELEQCKDMLRAQRAEDIEKVRQTLYAWDPDTVFHDPCLQALFDQFNEEISQLEAELDAASENCAAADEAVSGAKTDAPFVVRAMKERSDWWDSVIFQGGPWQEEEGGCLELLAFSRRGIRLPPEFLLRRDLRVQFNMLLHKGLSKDGLSFADALKQAKADPSVYPASSVHHPAIQYFWEIYAACLKRVHKKMFMKWFEIKFPNSTNEERERGWKIACDPNCATESERTQCAELDSRVAGLQAERAVATAAKSELEAAHRDLRAEFRRRAHEDCFPAQLQHLNRKLVELAMLRAFFAWCDAVSQNPENPDPKAGTVHHGFTDEEFCRLLQELIQQLRNMQQAGVPVPQAYLQFLESFFLRGGTCHGR